MNSEIMKCEDPLYVVTGTPQMVRFLCDQAIVLLQCLSKIYKKSIHLEALKPSSHLQTSLSMGGMLHCAAVHTALLQELLNFVQKLWSSFLIIKPSSSSHSKSSTRPCTRFLKCFILNMLCSKKTFIQPHTRPRTRLLMTRTTRIQSWFYVYTVGLQSYYSFYIQIQFSQIWDQRRFYDINWYFFQKGTTSNAY